MKYEIMKNLFFGENPKSIFEVGCGSGGLLNDVYDYYNRNVEVGGLDINRYDIMRIKKLFPKHKDNFLHIQLSLANTASLHNLYSIDFLIFTFSEVTPPFQFTFFAPSFL